MRGYLTAGDVEHAITARLPASRLAAVRDLGETWTLCVQLSPRAAT
jgi:hypothetical protein